MFFNLCFKDCILNMQERTTGRTEVENKMLKIDGNDQRTTLTKLASNGKKRQKIRENNLGLNSSRTNRMILSGALTELKMIANQLTAHHAKKFETQCELSKNTQTCCAFFTW